MTPQLTPAQPIKIAARRAAIMLRDRASVAIGWRANGLSEESSLFRAYLSVEAIEKLLIEEFTQSY